MKNRKILFYIFAMVLISSGVFVVILFNINPYETDLLNKIAFFASIFFIISGLFTFLGYWVRMKRANFIFQHSFLFSSIRQASLLAFITIGILILSTLRVFNWWDALLLTLSISMLELFFQTRSTNLPSFIQKEIPENE